MRHLLTLAVVLLALPALTSADETNDGVYKGPLTGACRSGTVTLTISGTTVLYHPAPEEEGTAALKEDGTFHLSMISNARFRGSTIAVDGKLSDGKIAGEFVATGSFKCTYSFAAVRQ